MSAPSGPPATTTAFPVHPSPDPASGPTSTLDNEKHKSTSPVDDEKHHAASESPHHHPSSPLPTEAPVLGAVGFVGESFEKSEAAATAFKHHPSPAPATHDHAEHHGEKGGLVVDEKGVAGSGKGTESETTPGETDGEDDDEVIYPGGLQLSLLTFGLCVATFTVALGEYSFLLIFVSSFLSGYIR